MKPTALRLITITTSAILMMASSAFATSAASASAGPVNPRPGITLNDLSEQSTLGLTLALSNDDRLYAQTDEQAPDYSGNVYGYKPKSSRRAFLQSFIIPGWGQWYNGSRIKPILFVGLEAAGWLGWSHFRGQGKDLEDKYRAFADDPITGWDFDKYANGLAVVYDIEADTIPYRNPKYDPINNDEPEFLVFSHHILPSDLEDRSNTYYENLGKYDQFVFGWSDYPDMNEVSDTTGVNRLTTNRANYLGQRDDANREFSHASTVLILTIGNHLLSAFEAAIGAKRYNRAMDQFGSIDTDLRLTQSTTSSEFAPRFTVRYHF